MHQFFVDDAQVAGNCITIEGGDVNHIKNVLRMRGGETIRVSSVEGKNYLCEVAEIGEAAVTAEIVEELAENNEPSNRIYLFQGLPKGDKMELIIQKAVELGVHAVIPVSMKNCVVKLDSKRAEAKRARWQEIAKSAAKQSKRGIIPEVCLPVTFSQAVERAAECDVRLAAYENERGMRATRDALSAVKPGESIAIFIGPEGGFDASELLLAKENAQIISLGNRILRTETAGMALLSMLVYQLEE